MIWVRTGWSQLGLLMHLQSAPDEWGHLGSTWSHGALDPPTTGTSWVTAGRYTWADWPPAMCFLILQQANSGLFTQWIQGQSEGKRARACTLTLLPHATGQSKLQGQPRSKDWGKRLDPLMTGAMQSHCKGHGYRERNNWNHPSHPRISIKQDNGCFLLTHAFVVTPYPCPLVSFATFGWPYLSLAHLLSFSCRSEMDS